MQGVGRGFGGAPPPGFAQTGSGIGRGMPQQQQQRQTNFANAAAGSVKGGKNQFGPYIPGLTQRPADLPPPPGAPPPPANELERKKVPPELIESFLNGNKNPVSAIMEYAAIRRLPISFFEVSIETPSILAKFACECKIDGQKFPQGVGKTKKEAKTNAAKLAFTQILGLGEEDVLGEDDTGTVMYDARGTKIVIKDDYSMSTRSTKGIDSADLANAASALERGATLCQPKKDLGPNPVSALNEYCAKHGVPFTVEIVDVEGNSGYTAKICTRGQLIAASTSTNKADAKKAAHQQALEYLKGTMTQSEPDVTFELHSPDQVANLCYMKLYKLLEQKPDLLDIRKYFAAFVIKRGEEDRGEVVAIGVGNTCLSVDQHEEATKGRSLLDSYGITLARRALLKYMHKEMKSYLDGNKVLSIFQEQSGSHRLMLKDYISLHLFISHAPVGDYLMNLDSAGSSLTPDQQELIEHGAHFPAFPSDKHGRLCTKNEDGLICPVEAGQSPRQTMEQYKEGEDLLVMSCSDKLLRWNVLGVQGALFAQYLHPIYIHSLIFGSKFDHGHACRAVCCRVYDILGQSLVEPYHIHHPLILSTSVPVDQVYHEGETLARLAVNWSLGDDLIEMTDGWTGKEVELSPFKSGPVLSSRLCKAAFLNRFRDLAKAFKRTNLLNSRTFMDSKKQSREYQAAKHSFLTHLPQAGIGCWVQKPLELELFEK